MAHSWGRLDNLSSSTKPSVALVGAEFTIGRGSTCAHIIENPVVSKFVSMDHCSIRQVGTRYTLSSSSSNGTFLNDTKVEKNKEPVDLKDGDVISLIASQEAAQNKFGENAIVYQFFGQTRLCTGTEADAALMPPPDLLSAGTTASANAVCRTTSSERRALADHYNVDSAMVLGEGQFGKVYACTDTATRTKILAVKQIKKKRSLGRMSKSDAKTLENEVRILKKLKHTNIVNVVDIFETPELLSIVMERVTGGELFDYILDNGKLEESESKQLVAQILRAVAYLHGKNIVHRDLKPENVLIERTSDGSCPAVKVADFGTARALDSQRRAQTYCGTPTYFAPEVHLLQGPAASPGQTYGPPCDMWSIGVIVYIMLSGMPRPRAVHLFVIAPCLPLFYIGNRYGWQSMTVENGSTALV